MDGRRAALLAAPLLALVVAAPARAEVRASGPLDISVLIATHYRVVPNQPYLMAGGWTGHLDLYLPRHPPAGPMPVALLFHGGGWETGSKDEIALDAVPYLVMGIAVANVEYRLARTAPAPAAVQDARCALRWVVRHADQYGLDTHRVVTVGSSAGAHLALMAGLAPQSAGFDDLCPGNEPMRVAAVVNFFGISDVAKLLQPESLRDFAVGWIGPRPDREDLARRLSPLTYVAKDNPPVFTVHGDTDPIVPFEQATRLHAALAAAGVPNRLYVVPHGGHGEFTGAEVLLINRAVHDFLIKHGVIHAGRSPLLQ
ncbi:MAG TPA: alpha/beta hydrolase [Polyangia bacterium]|nr:alpha/beta hydrolase [Polyangia bacterium]